jgi:hypothetical protein
MDIRVSRKGFSRNVSITQRPESLVEADLRAGRVAA